MMDRNEFEQQVRDVLANLYDYAALETHPLAAVFPKPPDVRCSRAEHLRRLLLQEIERLRPPGRELTPDSVGSRPYLILHARYVRGESLQDLQGRLSLSARQLRREHGRAVRAVAALLWERAVPGQVDAAAVPDVGPGGARLGAMFQSYDVVRESLDVGQVVRGVADILQRRVQSAGAELRLAWDGDLPPVRADRVILRQILLSLIGHALHVRSKGDITLGAEVRGGWLALILSFAADEPAMAMAGDGETSLEAVRYWARRLDATLRQVKAPAGQGGVAHLILSLPRADRPVILVVDDQEAAIRMYRRYLGRFDVQVVGICEPEQALDRVRDLQPRAIALDVMMPTMDGWEILQALKADPETCQIPVLVCSVWDEPELAFSLGAAGFLKKPITQNDLLDWLARLNLLDTTAGSCPTDSPEQEPTRGAREDGAS
jgi:CheY-like chemotaxis protein